MIAGTAGTASAWATVFNLCNSTVGAGVLSFPMAFHLTGWMGGLVLCPIVATIVLVPLVVLAKKASKHGSRTYQALVGDTLGPTAANFVAWLVLFYIYGACTAFMIIVGSSFQALLQRFILYNVPDTLHSLLSSRSLSIFVPSTLIILPLSLLPSMEALAATSSVALAVYSFNITAVATEFLSQAATRPSGSPIVPSDAETFHWRFEAVKAVPIMIFAYQCHVQSVPLFSEMTTRPRLITFAAPQGSTASHPESSGNSKLRGIIPVFILTFVTCTVLYITMGLSGYLLFPVNTRSNILNNFGIDNNLILVIQILVGFAVSLHYPVDLHVARTALYDLVCGCLGKVPVYPAPHASLAKCTLAIWGGSLVLACLVTDLGRVFQLLGGVACTLVIFILPGMMLVFDEVAKQASAVVDDVQEGLSSDAQMHGVLNGAEGIVDQVPLLTTQGVNSRSGMGAQQASSSEVVGEQNNAGTAALYTGVIIAGSSRPDCVTRVLGWSMVSFGSCIMCLTAYLTFFG